MVKKLATSNLPSQAFEEFIQSQNKNIVFKSKVSLLKNFQKMSQGPPNPGFMQEQVKSTERGFSKKALARIEKLFLFGFYESLKHLGG